MRSGCNARPATCASRAGASGWPSRSPTAPTTSSSTSPSGCASSATRRPPSGSSTTCPTPAPARKAPSAWAAPSPPSTPGRTAPTRPACHVVLPAGFTPTLEGDPLKVTDVAGGTVLSASAIQDRDRWFAWVTAEKPDALATSDVAGARRRPAGVDHHEGLPRGRPVEPGRAPPPDARRARAGRAHRTALAGQGRAHGERDLYPAAGRLRRVLPAGPGGSPGRDPHHRAARSRGHPARGVARLVQWCSLRRALDR